MVVTRVGGRGEAHGEVVSNGYRVVGQDGRFRRR